LQISAELAQQLTVDPDTVGEVTDSERETNNRHYRQTDRQTDTQTRLSKYVIN